MISPQSTLTGWDAFVTKMNAQGTALVYSTFHGGIVVTAGGSILVAGWTGSNDFPIVSPLQPNSAGSRYVFVSKFGSDEEATLSVPAVAFLNIGPVDTEGRTRIEVSNTSAAPVVIQDISVSPTPPFEVENPALPFELTPGATLAIAVFLTSEPDVAQEGILTITSNAATLQAKPSSKVTATTTATLKVKKSIALIFQVWQSTSISRRPTSFHRNPII